MCNFKKYQIERIILFVFLPAVYVSSSFPIALLIVNMAFTILTLLVNM